MISDADNNNHGVRTMMMIMTTKIIITKRTIIVTRTIPKNDKDNDKNK